MLGVLCHTARKIEIFSVMGRRRRPFSPAAPKIFAGAYARPETGMDFGLAFMTPRSQTVNVGV